MNSPSTPGLADVLGEDHLPDFAAAFPDRAYVVRGDVRRLVGIEDTPELMNIHSLLARLQRTPAIRIRAWFRGGPDRHEQIAVDAESAAKLYRSGVREPRRWCLQM
jgi:hypothetical protein